MENKPFIVKRRGDDGFKIISVRIRESMVEELDRLAEESHYSRNELITLMLKHGIENIQIE